MVNDSSSVDVVIPTHKADGSVVRAVRSVLDQTSQPASILVIDDSRDGSVADDETLAAVSTLKVLRSEARSASGARNLGVQAASSDYVAFLDDDDVWHSNHLEHFLTRIREPGTSRSFLYSGVANVLHASTGEALGMSEPERLVGKRAIAVAMANRITTSGVVVSRELLLDNPFDLSLPRKQDRDLWVRLIAGGAKLIVGTGPTVDYYWEPAREGYGPLRKANNDMALKLRRFGFSRTDVAWFIAFSNIAFTKRLASSKMKSIMGSRF